MVAIAAATSVVQLSAARSLPPEASGRDRARALSCPPPLLTHMLNEMHDAACACRCDSFWCQNDVDGRMAGLLQPPVHRRRIMP